jgi:hypothetical protein
MKTSRTKTLALPYPLLVLLALPMTACGGNAGDNAAPEKTDTSSAAVTWLGDAYWGQPGNAGPDADIGSASGMTCFLTGLHGQLLGTNDNSTDGPEATARVFIDPFSGDWKMQTHQGVGNGVNMRVACVPYTANREFFFSENGETFQQGGYDESFRSVVTIPQSSPNRECFLTGLSAWNGFNQAAGQGDAYLRGPGPASTGQDPNAWQFITDVDGVNGSGGSFQPGGSAEAVCVDTGALQGSVGPLSQSSIWWFSNEANLACGLTMIAGTLSYDPLGGNDGVGLSYNTSLSGWWGINATSGKTVAATCVR